MKNKTYTSKKGFTLIEFIIAVALLAIVASLAIVGSHYLSKITGEIMDDTQQQQMLNTTERIMADYLSYANGIDEYSYSINEDIDLNMIISKSSADYRNLRVIYLDGQSNTLYVYSIIKENVIVGVGKEYQLLAERKADNVLDIELSTDYVKNNVCYAKYQITVKNPNGKSKVLLRNILPLRNFKPARSSVSDNISGTDDYVDDSYTFSDNQESGSKVFVLYYDDV